jgi:hypothetical protein
MAYIFDRLDPSLRMKYTREKTEPTINWLVVVGFRPFLKTPALTEPIVPS